MRCPWRMRNAEPDFCGFLARWQNCNSMCDNQQSFVPERFQKVVETLSNLASGKAPLRQIDIISSPVWMTKVRHRSSEKPSCGQPRGRVCPGLSHDVSTAEDRVIMEFPSSHPQNKELLFFSDPMGLHRSQYRVFGVPMPPLMPLIPVAPMLPTQMQKHWTPYSQEIWNTESCREANLVSACSTFALEQIQLAFVGRRDSAGFGWEHWVRSKGVQIALPSYVILSHPSQVQGR